MGDVGLVRRMRVGLGRVALVGLGLLLAEGVLRLLGAAYPAWDRETPGLGAWGIPHAAGWAVGETRQWVELNSIGVHDREHRVKNPEDAFRVVVVGDSFAAAFEVEVAEAFWAVAERELATCEALAGRPVELVSVSKRGFGTTEELLALRRFGFAYEPDWVVLAFLTGNDLRNNSQAVKRSKRPYYVYGEDGALVLDESYAEESDFVRWSGWQGDLWYGLVARSRLAQVVRHVRRQVKVLVAIAGREVGDTDVGFDDETYWPPADDAWRQAWRVSEDVIRMMRDEVTAQGARFLLMTLSNPIQVNPDREVRAAYANRIGVDDFFYADDRLAAFAARESIPLLQMARPLRAWSEANGRCAHGFAEPYLCTGHWNTDGHEQAGRALARRLCEAVRANAAGSGDDA